MSATVLPLRSAAARLLALFAAFVLSACTVGLVPAYDADLAEGLSAAHANALVQFARVEEGSPREDYPAHAETYAVLIGAFGELRSRAATRPIPPLATRLAKTSVFRRVCPATDDPEVCLNATPESIASVLSTLRTMRTTHRTEGLEPAIVDLFKREYLTAVDQALTVEAALQR
jgi:hypothetical protein